VLVIAVNYPLQLLLFRVFLRAFKDFIDQHSF
jgi:hypothetical protein